jgi:hypothetical protein
MMDEGRKAGRQEGRKERKDRETKTNRRNLWQDEKVNVQQKCRATYDKVRDVIKSDADVKMRVMAHVRTRLKMHGATRNVT